MTPIQSAQEYVNSGCDQFSKEHIVALIAECERLSNLSAESESIGMVKVLKVLKALRCDALAARKEQS